MCCMCTCHLASQNQNTVTHISHIRSHIISSDFICYQGVQALMHTTHVMCAASSSSSSSSSWPSSSGFLASHKRVAYMANAAYSQTCNYDEVCNGPPLIVGRLSYLLRRVGEPDPKMRRRAYYTARSCLKRCVTVGDVAPSSPPASAPAPEVRPPSRAELFYRSW